MSFLCTTFWQIGKRVCLPYFTSSILSQLRPSSPVPEVPRYVQPMAIWEGVRRSGIIDLHYRALRLLYMDKSMSVTQLLETDGAVSIHHHHIQISLLNCISFQETSSFN